MRVTFLTIMPSPYTLDVFAAMEQDGRITPRVLYMEMAMPDTHWGTVNLPGSATLLRGGAANFAGGRIQWNFGVIGDIRRSRPELVVVAGYSSLTSQLVMAWLRGSGTPWVFWGEIPGMRKLGRLGRYVRGALQYPAVRWPNAIAAMGSRAAEEYRRLARPGCDIANIPYHTELKPFLDQPRPARTNRVRLLYCGQLIERKGLAALIDAFVNVAADCPQLELMLVGEGPLWQSLSERVPSQLRDCVVFAGFQPVDRLPDFFSEADVFVLPSLHDGWGVVVNQALGAGLPIICSSAVGAADDLVRPGWNGTIVPPADVPALTKAIRELSVDQDRRVSFGENSRAAAWDWTPSRGVDRWVELAERVLGRRPVGAPSAAAGER